MDILWLLVLVLGQYVASNQQTEPRITPETVKWWAEHIRIELKNVADFFTRKDLAKENFKQATLELRNDSRITEEIAEAIGIMMNSKVEAVKRIVDIAEEKARAAGDEVATAAYEYYNSKCIDGLLPDMEEFPCSNQTVSFTLKQEEHFWNLPVNTSFSSVHVPTSVFDRSREVLQAIKWSKELDGIFRKNYEDDPSMSWQYFGSSTGFMRHYPAMEWKKKPVDLYDCRTRLWYVEAASSPKDMVILIDHSGSMTGVRKEIARHVVEDILDTLGNNDYVNIIKFNEDTSYAIECFENRLVQANLANIRAFKEVMENMTTEKIANFSSAFKEAFQLLEQYREPRDDPYRGANCNQAIMLITDGVPEKFTEIFKEFNWPNLTVRIFTYLVGREVPDVRDIRWMACANRGYYVHLSTLAEVREKVLQYVPVMARPLVLTKKKHPVIWTPVYAESMDPKMTDWIWEVKEKAVQRKILLDARPKNGKVKNLKINATQIELQKVETEVNESERLDYKLMTSVSIPVFDKRDYANITKRVLFNEEIWVDETREFRIAALLGVAGTDVRIDDIKKFMNPFKLGVGGYAFIITNNGYVLYHPDLRVEYYGILKPNYNSVDFIEIEVTQREEGRAPREHDEEILALRKKIVEGGTGRSGVMKMMFHMNWMKRGGVTDRRYYYAPIANSPFTVVIAVPVTYGPYRINSSLEIKLLTLEGKEKVTDWFRGENWRLHPDWVYCRYANESYRDFTKEEGLCHFLRRSQGPGWKWPNMTSPQSAYNRSFAKDSYYCDRDLIQSLVYDAKMTQWFTEDLAKTNITFKDLKDRFGVTSIFIATRSGLTRWQNFSGQDRGEQMSFGDLHPRAVDEVWYRRAVDHHFSHPDNRGGYVYSVPFHEEPRTETLVTVSHAVFVEQGDGRAPVAVVGYQFQHKALRDLFFNKTSLCPGPNKRCHTCASEYVDCYVLDNHGYIVASENSTLTGMFFGSVRRNVMYHLYKARIFHKHTYYDFQGVCSKLKGPPVTVSNSCSKVVYGLTEFVKWLLSSVFWFGYHLGVTYAQVPLSVTDYFGGEDEIEGNSSSAGHSDPVSPEARNQINKTRPEGCDQKLTFFELQYDQLKKDVPTRANWDCELPYYVHRIEGTNLLLVVVNNLCLCKENCYVNIDAIEVTDYNDEVVCHKFFSNNLPRRRPQQCISTHIKENETTEMCGRGSRLSYNNRFFTILISFVSYWCWTFC